MIKKYYSKSGMIEFLKEYPKKNNRDWFEKLITEVELKKIHVLLDAKDKKDNLNNNINFSIDRLNGKYLKDDEFSERINNFIDKTLPDGNICSIASGYGDREYWLLTNQSKKRKFYVSDLLNYEILNFSENYINKNLKKKCFFSYKTSVNVISLPYKSRKFDAIYSGSVLFALSNQQLKEHIIEMLRVLKLNGTGIIWCYSWISPIMKLKFLIKIFMFHRKNPLSKNSGFIRDLKEFNSIIYSIIKKENCNVTKMYKKKSNIITLITKVPIIKKLYLLLDFDVVFYVFKKRK